MASRAGAMQLEAMRHLVAGRPHEAESLLREAIRAEPGAADVHVLLAAVLNHLGKYEDAVSSCAVAIAIDPRMDNAHQALGNAFAGAGDAARAEAAFMRCLHFAPGNVDAMVGLGNLLLARGASAEARKVFANAVSLRPESIEPLLGLAGAELAMGAVDAAEGWAARAVELSPTDDRAAAVLAMALSAGGKGNEGAELLCARIVAPASGAELASAVGSTTLRRALLQLLGEPLERLPAQIGPAMLALLGDDGLEDVPLARAASRVVGELPAFRAMFAAKHDGLNPLGEHSEAAREFATDAVVLAALGRVVLVSADVERGLRVLRREIARRVVRGESLPFPAAFVSALARQLDLSEHPWTTDVEEAADRAALRARIEAQLSAGLFPGEALLAAFATFEPPSLLAGAGLLVTVVPQRVTDGVASILELVAESQREAQLADGMACLTPIEGNVSAAVRTMYEESPYPRWTRLPRERSSELPVLVRALRPRSVATVAADAPILVAGCGTGRHALAVARAYPRSPVLGIDLSRRSLAYASRMMEKLGVPNLRLAQADILQLDATAGRFQLIESVGVLHHLDDPWQGLSVLRTLLMPGGVMRIGVYARRGRASVQAARDALAGVALPPGLDGVRAARDVLLGLPAGHPGRAILESSDFWSTSNCRDLLLHVHEHLMTVADLRQGLARAGMRFIGFDVPPPVRDRFLAGGGDWTDLAAWDRFEAANPGTFSNMYIFWCEIDE